MTDAKAEAGSEDAAPGYDSILLVSFGGPEKREDVMPFLENVVRGKRVPKERLLEVAEHYYGFDGKSPINDQNRALIAALRAELDAHDIDLPIYWGNRNWHPMLGDTLREMKEAGHHRALGVFTSAFSSYSGCRQYRENIEGAREEVGEGAPTVDKVRVFYNHPLFIETMVERTKEALEQLPEGRRETARIAFTAHSIPQLMADHCKYAEQLEEACRLVAEEAGRSDWQLVYQSRSGPPQVPWLGPDVVEHAEALNVIGVEELVVVPIGFISDHMEVIYDLDHELKDACEEMGMTMVRAGTAGTHPKFVAMLRELIEERLGRTDRRRAVGQHGPSHDVCPTDCCLYPVRKRRPPSEERKLDEVTGEQANEEPTAPTE
ncbi:MAG TPA: ferrochelatase [Polyangiaceae bacterium LLY-WYZ-15_(1-7)]|nr:ferrochelatase [Polyangiaceae bacterium LLY-WYZ-15_(1-7)]HJL10230.1 ferrochelatase [Polyangiaceae bacterium LLY-WYZ-15_(1-7)]HJL24407.1 ferrochelatase [Polyangiaceae bacterium LLY-WYZ-15_(1-7)]HJL31361.1 ferrochelatase [Polyangiaceae bacterium LLY-WYZ-15_(1-7)]HJL37763.1 ferrochelatase [Polyangiaceae bacterium LLY-WYZ-15_(1-7)]